MTDARLDVGEGGLAAALLFEARLLGGEGGGGAFAFGDVAQGGDHDGAALVGNLFGVEFEIQLGLVRMEGDGFEGAVVAEQDAFFDQIAGGAGEPVEQIFSGQFLHLAAEQGGERLVGFDDDSFFVNGDAFEGGFVPAAELFRIFAGLHFQRGGHRFPGQPGGRRGAQHFAEAPQFEPLKQEREQRRAGQHDAEERPARSEIRAPREPAPAAERDRERQPEPAGGEKEKARAGHDEHEDGGFFRRVAEGEGTEAVDGGEHHDERAERMRPAQRQARQQQAQGEQKNRGGKGRAQRGRGAPRFGLQRGEGRVQLPARRIDPVADGEDGVQETQPGEHGQEARAREDFQRRRGRQFRGGVPDGMRLGC